MQLPSDLVKISTYLMKQLIMVRELCKGSFRHIYIYIYIYIIYTNTIVHVQAISRLHINLIKLSL